MSLYTICYLILVNTHTAIMSLYFLIFIKNEVKINNK